MPRPKDSTAAPTETSEGKGSSAERSLRMLALLARAGKALSLSDLAAELGLPKATVHRLAATLMDTGFLARDIDERSFAVGPALRELAFDTLNHDTARGLRHQLLAALVDEVGETCNFTTLDGAGVLYLDRVEAKWPLRLTLDVGSHVPLHCTASGKLFLALMASEQRELIIERLPLPRMTAHTLVTRKALRAECETIAARGYSTDGEEFIAGLIAAAVPVRNAQGRVCAAIAVHAPAARMSLDAAIGKLGALRAAADRMGRLL